jgi:hypothetical protein
MSYQGDRPMKLKRKVYQTRREKRIDFFIGFFGWYVVNAMAFIIVSAIGSIADGVFGPGVTSEAAQYILLALPLVLNVVAIVLLALSRTWISLGILAAIGAAFLVVLVGGLLLMAVCFSTF